jgi:hypothetical protein
MRTHGLSKNLITADKLAKATRAALTLFQTIDFATKQASRHKLRNQYRKDAAAHPGYRPSLSVGRVCRNP